jgi:hypothetical protein
MPQLSTSSSETARESLVSIMKQKLVILVAGKRLSQLLQSPIGSRMFGDIEMDESPIPDLHSHE